MFSLFKKKQAQSEPPLKKKIKDMKCRKINYVDEGFDTLASEMSADPKAILRLKPVNYYAINKDYNLKGLITIKDIEKQIKYPLSAKDDQGRLLCGAGVHIGSTWHKA